MVIPISRCMHELDARDLVALSGAHTLGIAHCTSFEDRLFPKQDGTMNQWFAGQLKLTCPALNTTNTTVNDIRTPNVFDNKYYVDLLTGTKGQIRRNCAVPNAGNELPWSVVETVAEAAESLVL